MLQIKCPIADEWVDPIEAYLCEAVRSNWSIFNVREGEPYFLMGYFQDEAVLYAEYGELCREFTCLPDQPELIELEDIEWQEAYKAYLQPWSFGILHWVPVWQRESYAVPAGEKAIYLDAGMAFGTGSHETTRLMAMRLLDFYQNCTADDKRAKRVIDAGCGSGILAISAAALGFRSVYGFDRDPEAIRVSRANSICNQLSDNAIEFVEAGLEAGLEGRTADLLLANIQAEVLQIHADGLLKAVAPGGTLCLSGILLKELDQVRGVFEDLAGKLLKGAVQVDARHEGEWSDLKIVLPL